MQIIENGVKVEVGLRAGSGLSGPGSSCLGASPPSWGMCVGEGRRLLVQVTFRLQGGNLQWSLYLDFLAFRGGFGGRGYSIRGHLI